MEPQKTYGQVAYEAWAAKEPSVATKWSELDTNEVARWEAAADAVSFAVSVELGAQGKAA